MVIDSKWRTALREGEVDFFVQAGRRQRLKASALVLSAMDRSTGKHRGRARWDVESVIAVWGPERARFVTPHVVDGVHVIDGNHLLTWLAERDGDEIHRSAARSVLQRLRVWASNRRNEAESAA